MTDKEETTPSTTASTNDGLKQNIEAQEQSEQQPVSQTAQQGQGGEQQSGQTQQQEQGGEQQSDEPKPLDEMTFWDHLEALRWMLVRVFSALGIFIIGGFAFIPWIFEHVIMAPSTTSFSFTVGWQRCRSRWPSCPTT